MQHLQHRYDNPGTGMATLGALVGGLLGGLAGTAVMWGGHRLIKGPVSDVTTTTERIISLGIGTASMVGAAWGASLGAAPHQRGRAFAGSLYGGGAVTLARVAFPTVGTFWTFGPVSAAAATGTAIGAATATPQ
jgi:hypothetical protein